MDPKEKARRKLEKAMRQPVNDVVLEVQKGTININDLFKKIEVKVAGKIKEAKDGKASR